MMRIMMTRMKVRMMIRKTKAEVVMDAQEEDTAATKVEGTGTGVAGTAMMMRIMMKKSMMKIMMRTITKKMTTEEQEAGAVVVQDVVRAGALAQ